MDTFNKTGIDQGKLVALLRSRDKKAMELLYDQYSASVFGVAFIITKNEDASEKILTDTFLYAWKHHATFNETYQNLKLWLVGIARRISHAHVSFDDFLKNHVDPVYVSSKGDRVLNGENSNLRTTAGMMTDEQKKIFELVFFGGGKIHEVAKHFSMNESDIKQLLRNAIHQYRKELEQA